MIAAASAASVAAAAAAAVTAVAANLLVFADRAFGGELAHLHPPLQMEIRRLI